MNEPPAFLLRQPRIAPTAFIAPNATLLGDVSSGTNGSRNAPHHDTASISRTDVLRHRSLCPGDTGQGKAGQRDH